MKTARKDKPFVHENLGNRVAEYLREEILWTGVHRKGEHIQEKDIAARLGISRAPVREGLKELEHQGLVEFIPRKGTFVADFDQEDLVEIYDIRHMMETRVFETVIGKDCLGAEDFRKLRSIVDEMVELARSDLAMEEKIAAFSEHDIAFHQYIWEKSGRNWSYRILSNLYYQLRLAMMQDLIMEQDIERSAVMHYAIVDSLEARDLNGAKEALVRHIATLWRESEKDREEITGMLREAPARGEKR
jgi:DNA-binding GntR family transcriptional regulator